tara:strand:- start:1940 stop:2371 length:432 start_codon:yes stop_codon:yes gene_type:complete
MDSLPYDIIYKISCEINDVLDIISFKKVNKELNNSISSYTIAKKKLTKKHNKPVYYVNCINANCYYDTCEIFEDYYNEYHGRYIHYHQPSQNYNYIKINNKMYNNVFTPYCVECFKNFVFKSNIDETRIVDNLNEYFVDIIYS